MGNLWCRIENEIEEKTKKKYFLKKKNKKKKKKKQKKKNKNKKTKKGKISNSQIRPRTTQMECFHLCMELACKVYICLFFI